MRNKFSMATFFNWLTLQQHNLKSFSILRIIYGVALLALYVPSMSERSLLWGEASFWVNPEASRRGYWTFDTIFSKDSAMLFDLAYFTFLALIIVFILGWRTRIIPPIMLLFLVAMHANNSYVLNGGDTLLRITLFFMLFANLRAHYSLDSRRRKRKNSSVRRIVPTHISNAAHNTGLVLSCFQIIVVYTTSAVWKLLGEAWLDGTALFYALRIDNFMLYPALNELLWQSTQLIHVATFISLWVQTLFVIFVLWRPTRIFALVSLIFMHLGIGLLLGLWTFSLVMIALDMLFIRDKTWNAILTWAKTTRLYESLETVLRDRRTIPGTAEQNDAHDDERNEAFESVRS